MSGLKIVFCDTETTGLGPKRQIWDLALIVRDGESPDDVEHQWFFPVDLAKADPIALDIGRYYDRHPDPWDQGPGMRGADAVSYWPHHAGDIAGLLRGALVVGAVPWFDTQALDRTLRRYGALPTWNHHLVDVEALAAGRLGMRPPWNFDQVLAGFGLARGEDRHTAIGDARLVRDLYDKVTAGWGGVL